MPGFKYGLLVLASREGLSVPLRMNDATECLGRRIATTSLIPTSGAVSRASR
jgi:hypothetical protein